MLGGIGRLINGGDAPAVLELTADDIRAMARQSLESAQRSLESHRAALIDHPNDGETPTILRDVEQFERWVEVLTLAADRVKAGRHVMTYAQLMALRNDFCVFKTYEEIKREEEMNLRRKRAEMGKAETGIPIS